MVQKRLYILSKTWSGGLGIQVSQLCVITRSCVRLVHTLPVDLHRMVILSASERTGGLCPMSYGDVCYNHGSALKCDLWLGLGLGRGVCTKIRHHNTPRCNAQSVQSCHRIIACVAGWLQSTCRHPYVGFLFLSVSHTIPKLPHLQAWTKLKPTPT